MAIPADPLPTLVLVAERSSGAAFGLASGPVGHDCIGDSVPAKGYRHADTHPRSNSVDTALTVSSLQRSRPPATARASSRPSNGYMPRSFQGNMSDSLGRASTRTLISAKGDMCISIDQSWAPRSPSARFNALVHRQLLARAAGPVNGYMPRSFQGNMSDSLGRASTRTLISAKGDMCISIDQSWAPRSPSARFNALIHRQLLIAVTFTSNGALRSADADARQVRQVRGASERE